MNVIAVQYDIAWEQKTANHAKVRAMLKGATSPGDLVVLPEMFATGFSMNVAQIAEDSQRPSETFLAQLARELKICIIGGVVNGSSDGRGLNQAVAFATAGQEIARYTKLHPFTFGKEGEHYDAGREVVTFTWNAVVVAPFVCYDLRFPEVFRVAALRGAEMMVVMANWPAPRVQHWVTLLQARAIENQAYVIGVNRIGSDPHVSYPGRSMIIDPVGQVIADAGEREGIIAAPCDVTFIRSCRQNFPALRDMRREFVSSPVVT